MSKLTLKDETLAPGVSLVSVEGDLDASTADQLDTLFKALIEGGASKLVIDVDKVSYIASAGVGVFVAHIQTLRNRSGDLVILYSSYVPPEDTSTGLVSGYNPLEVFDMLGLLDLIKVGRTPEEAVRLAGG